MGRRLVIYMIMQPIPSKFPNEENFLFFISVLISPMRKLRSWSDPEGGGGGGTRVMYTDQSFAEASYPSLNRHFVKSPLKFLYKKPQRCQEIFQP
jgi:hypothetical protein